MEYMTGTEFCDKFMRNGHHWNKKTIKMTDAKWQVLPFDVCIFCENSGSSGKSFVKGSKFKVFETPNFGWIVFHPGTKDGFGNEVSKRILKVQHGYKSKTTHA